MHKTMHMPASKSKKNEKLIRHHPEEKKIWRTKIKKNPAKMLRNRVDQVYYQKSCHLKHSTSIYRAEENASVQNITPLVLLRKCAPLRKQSKSITLSGRLNLSSHNSAVPVPNKITRRSYYAVIHESVFWLASVIVLWKNGKTKVVHPDSTVKKLLCWNRLKYLSSASHLTPD